MKLDIQAMIKDLYHLKRLREESRKQERKLRRQARRMRMSRRRYRL